MSEAAIRENSLVLYRARPARVQRADEKLSLELEGGESAKVRAKDVTPLHPGPLKSLAELRTARRRCADRLGDPGRQRHHPGGIG